MFIDIRKYVCVMNIVHVLILLYVILTTDDVSTSTTVISDLNESKLNTHLEANSLDDINDNSELNTQPEANSYEDINENSELNTQLEANNSTLDGDIDNNQNIQSFNNENEISSVSSIIDPVSTISPETFAPMPTINPDVSISILTTINPDVSESGVSMINPDASVHLDISVYPDVSGFDPELTLGMYQHMYV
jgi:hypothetical protein